MFPRLEESDFFVETHQKDRNKGEGVHHEVQIMRLKKCNMQGRLDVELQVVWLNIGRCPIEQHQAEGKDKQGVFD